MTNGQKKNQNKKQVSRIVQRTMNSTLGAYTSCPPLVRYALFPRGNGTSMGTRTPVYRTCSSILLLHCSQLKSHAFHRISTQGKHTTLVASHFSPTQSRLCWALAVCETYMLYLEAGCFNRVRDAGISWDSNLTLGRCTLHQWVWS